MWLLVNLSNAGRWRIQPAFTGQLDRLLASMLVAGSGSSGH